MEWSDLRVFLALAQHGSLRQAAQTLGVTQPTVDRRIRALERDLGLPLFTRTRDGHRLTAAGAELLPEVRAMESRALGVEQQALGLLTRLTRTVHIVAGETAAAVLARGLYRISDGPRIELSLADAADPPGPTAPDIVLRHGLPETAAGLTRRVGSIGCAVYGTAGYEQGRALPLSRGDLVTLPWLGFTRTQDHYVTMQWLYDLMRDRPPVARVMTTDLMATAAASGVGVAVLPCFVGDAAPGLVRLSSPIEDLRADYWTITHPDLSRNAAVRRVLEWVAACFRALEQGRQAGTRP